MTLGQAKAVRGCGSRAAEEGREKAIGSGCRQHGGVVEAEAEASREVLHTHLGTVRAMGHGYDLVGVDTAQATGHGCDPVGVGMVRGMDRDYDPADPGTETGKALGRMRGTGKRERAKAFETRELEKGLCRRLGIETKAPGILLANAVGTVPVVERVTGRGTGHRLAVVAARATLLWCSVVAGREVPARWHETAGGGVGVGIGVVAGAGAGAGVDIVLAEQRNGCSCVSHAVMVQALGTRLGLPAFS